MHDPIILPILITLATAAAAAAMAPPHLGLSLSPSLLTVAQANPNGTTTPFAHVIPTDEYQTILASFAAGKPLHNPTTLSHTLQQTLKLAQVETNTHFSARVNIPVLALPSSINDRTFIQTVKDSMLSIGLFPPAGGPSTLPLQVIELPLAAHYAYALGRPSSLGLETLDWEMDSASFLLVDSSPVVGLTLSLVDLAEHGCVTHGSSQVPQPDSTPALKQSLTDFLDRETLPVDTPASANTGTEWKPLRSDVRAVVLTRDSESSVFDQLKGALREVFEGREEGWMKDWVEPRDVGAVGAAKRARYLLDRGEEGDGLGVHVQWVDHVHDEL